MFIELLVRITFELHKPLLKPNKTYREEFSKQWIGNTNV